MGKWPEVRLFWRFLRRGISSGALPGRSHRWNGLSSVREAVKRVSSRIPSWKHRRGLSLCRYTDGGEEALGNKGGGTNGPGGG